MRPNPTFLKVTLALVAFRVGLAEIPGIYKTELALFSGAIGDAQTACSHLTTAQAAVCGKAILRMHAAGARLAIAENQLAKRATPAERAQARADHQRVFKDAEELYAKPALWYRAQSDQFAADAKATVGASDVQANVAFRAVYDLGGLTNKDLKLRFDAALHVYVIDGSAGVDAAALQSQLTAAAKRQQLPNNAGWAPADPLADGSLTLTFAK